MLFEHLIIQYSLDVHDFKFSWSPNLIPVVQMNLDDMRLMILIPLFSCYCTDHSQFCQAVSSIKLRLTTLMPYRMTVSVNNLIYFKLPKLVCVLLLVFHKVLKSNRFLTMKMDSDIHGAFTGQNWGHWDLTVHLMGNQLSLVAILKVTWWDLGTKCHSHFLQTLFTLNVQRSYDTMRWQLEGYAAKE